MATDRPSDSRDEERRMDGERILVPVAMSARLAAVAVQVVISHPWLYSEQWTDSQRERLQDSFQRHFDRVLTQK